MSQKPESLSEAVTIIRATFPENELSAWAALPQHEAQVDAHFALGVWVRNQWVHDGGSPLADQIRSRSSFVHPNLISEMVVVALWRVLNGQPCPEIDDFRIPGSTARSRPSP